MRVFVLLVLAACGSTSTHSECMADTDCGGEVCARDGECLPAAEVRFVKLSWTIRGSAASPTTCAQSPSFYVQFDSLDVNDSFGYSPVPCEQGQFTVDKLPKRYVQAEMGIDDRFLDAQAIDAMGQATFDLFP
jgi:ABC-type Fe3+-citrate transport system substrate-binding protein